MINAASFLKIVVEQFIEEAYDFQSKATDEFTRGQTMGYAFVVLRIFNTAATCDNLLDYLPDYLRNIIPESLDVYHYNVASPYWDTFTSKHRKAVIRHWNQKICNFREQIDILQGILDARK